MIGMELSSLSDVVDELHVFSTVHHPSLAAYVPTNGNATSSCETPPILAAGLHSEGELLEVAKKRNEVQLMNKTHKTTPNSTYTKQYEVLVTTEELQPFCVQSPLQALNISTEGLDCALDLSLPPKTEYISPTCYEPWSPPQTTLELEAAEVNIHDSTLTPPTVTSMSILADAARCLEVERSLREAENLLDGLLARFFEPCDLCTSVQNLPSPGESATQSSVRCRWKRNISNSSTFLAPPSFSPVFKHLLCLPEAQVLEDVQKLSPAAQFLTDLCNCLSGTIARSKRKLRQLNKLRIRRRRERVQIAQDLPTLTPSNQNETSSDLSFQRKTCDSRHHFQATLAEIVRQPFENTTYTAPPPSEHYSDPTHCPLSLLSFVFNLKGDGGEQLKQQPDSIISQLSVDIGLADGAASQYQHSDVGPVTREKQSPLIGRPRGRPRACSSPKRNKSTRNPGKKIPSASSNLMKYSKLKHANVPYFRSRNSSGPPLVNAEKKRSCDDHFLESKFALVPTYQHEHLPLVTFSPCSFNKSSLSPRLMEQLTVCVRPSLQDTTITDFSSSQNHSNLTNASMSTFASTAENVSPCLRSIPSRPSCIKADEEDDWDAWNGVGEEMQRPPTPELRRIDLDLADLSHGLRILLIEETHLRAGSLHFVDEMTSTNGEKQRHPCDSSRNRMCRVKLDSERGVQQENFHRAFSNSSITLATSSNERRGRAGYEVMLQAWQVLQQAVLEVIPASVRQLPPGTRVCAAWSEKLANYLYPGYISDTHSYIKEEASELLSLSVDFDDGDHREVPLSRIRMLPDHFANLAELGSAAGPVVKGSNATFRVRHASVSSSYTALAAQGKKKRKLSLPKLSDDTFKPQWRGIIKRSRLLIDTDDDADDDNDDGDDDDDDDKKEGEELEVENASSTASMSLKFDHCNWLAAGEAEGTSKKEDANLKEKPATISIRDVVWKPHRKLRRRYQRMTCFQSLKREKDGLVVSLGDVVKFNSGKNEQVYLGEIRFICQSNVVDAPPIVFASWFYYPEEAGDDGKLVVGYKGAIFSTEHMDKNEAQCIIGRVNVAESLSVFKRCNQMQRDQQCAENEPPKLTQIKRTADWSVEEISSSSDEDGDADDDVNDDDTDDETDSNSDGDDPKFFIAGKFDPIQKRVISWDVDLARELHLLNSEDN